NATISGNASGDGGNGLHNAADGTVNAYNTTIAFNEANIDDGVDATAAGVTNVPGGVFNLRNSIVARNYEVIGIFYYDDRAGTLSIYGNVYFTPQGVPGPGATAPPCTFSEGSNSHAYITIGGGELLALGNYGGPTPTHDLDPSSDAYDGADPLLGC